MKNRAVVFIFLLAVVFGGVCFAGIRGPGKYSGVVVFDRWDGCTLYSGIYVMYVSEKVKEQLRPYSGKAVEIKATDVHQPMNPGDGLIKSFEYIGPAKGKQPYGVVLKGVMLSSEIACKNGEKPAVVMEISNYGKDTVKIQSDELALTLLKKKDESKSIFSPADGPSIALLTRQNFWMGGFPGGESRWYGRQWTIGKENALPNTLDLKSGEKKRIKISFDLGEGEYEFLCGYGGGVHSGKVLASNSVGFDVDTKGLARIVKSKKQDGFDSSDEMNGWHGSGSMPVPEGAKVTLELDKEEYFLGENVLIKFVLENTGNESFDADFGGDYRGASRALRYKVTATDQHGNLVEDPDPQPNCFGGFGGPRTLKTGEKFTRSLALMAYRDIVKPGVYTVRVTHDFGWKEGQLKRPVGEVKVKFVMPSVEQAKRIVNERIAESDKRAAADKWYKHHAPYDFISLRQPVYLDILADLARKGDERLFMAIGKIPTVKATETLIELAGELEGKAAMKAASVLNQRLPYPQSHYIYTSKGRSKTQLSIRGRLVKRAWDDKLIKNVRTLAAKLLKSEDADAVSAGAFMVTCVGTKEDAAGVIEAIGNAKEATHKTRTDPKDNILNSPQPVHELLRAMDAIKERGYSAGQNVSGDQGILVYFHCLKGDSSERPERYGQMLDAYGTSSWPLIREAAVRSVPLPLTEQYKKYILGRLEDKDLGVCRAACSVAGKSGDKSFLRPLLDIIATEKHKWLLREAGNAANDLGGGYEMFTAWSQRLSDKEVYPTALDYLQNVFEGLPGGHSGRTDLSRAECLKLRKAWEDFLSEHTDEIRAGKRFKLSDPAVTPSLVGRARSWRFQDGSSWPK